MVFVLGTLLAKMNNLSTSDHSSVVSINLFVALLCACIVIGHLLEENRWMNESITALVIVSIYTHVFDSCIHVDLDVCFTRYMCVLIHIDH